jgi:hypothetical protein
MAYLFLRLESIIVFVTSLIIYYSYGGTHLGLVLIILPDISMIGYMKNPRLGAFVYNLGHSYVIPFITVIASYIFQSEWGLLFSFLWFAHVGLDRFLGFGLKFDTSFSDTHLGKLGQKGFFVRLAKRVKN